jgi:hypothetical protein
VLSTLAPLALAGAVHLYILITRHHPGSGAPAGHSDATAEERTTSLVRRTWTKVHGQNGRRRTGGPHRADHGPTHRIRPRGPLRPGSGPADQLRPGPPGPGHGPAGGRRRVPRRGPQRACGGPADRLWSAGGHTRGADQRRRRSSG